MQTNRIRKTGAILGGLAAAFLLAATAAAAPPPEAAVNVAGRQRMLSQRIVKAYCQIGLGVLPQASRAQLRDAVALFEAQLVTLEAGAPGPEERAALRALGSAWRPFKALALGPVNLERARRLYARGEEVLAAAQRVTLLLAAASPGTLGSLVNLAGRQRMLSQRLAKIYMLQGWGMSGPGLREDAETARAEFTAALATLQAAPRNTAEIGRELAAVELQWKWFENALALEGAHAYKLVVADASESIMNSMDRIALLYEQLAK